MPPGSNFLNLPECLDLFFRLRELHRLFIKPVLQVGRPLPLPLHKAMMPRLPMGIRAAIFFNIPFFFLSGLRLCCLSRDLRANRLSDLSAPAVLLRIFFESDLSARNALSLLAFDVSVLVASFTGADGVVAFLPAVSVVSR